jgi:hypothetical protein
VSEGRRVRSRGTGRSLIDDLSRAMAARLLCAISRHLGPGPGSTYAPARQHVRRIVDTQINAANSNSYCEKDREAKKIYFEP